MHTEREHIDPDALAKMGYERRDVNLKILGRTVVVFYIFALACSLFAAWVLYWGVHIGPIRIDPYIANTTTREKNEAANRAGRILPQSPNPLLQGNVTAKLDLQTMRQAEDERLNGTGYSDAAHTRAYIPIDKAMDLLAQRGLPKTGTEDAVTRGNDMEPFGTGTIKPPVRNAPEGDATLGNGVEPGVSSKPVPSIPTREGGVAGPPNGMQGRPIPSHNEAPSNPN